MADAKIVKLEIPSSAQFVNVARKTVEGIAASMALTDEQAEDLKLAVGEACANAVKFSDPGEPPVEILYRITRGSLEVEVRNKGKAFDPKNVQQKEQLPEQLPVGGLGLFLIDKVMDELNISSKCGETTLKMVKHLKR